MERPRRWLARVIRPKPSYRLGQLLLLNLRREGHQGHLMWRDTLQHSQYLRLLRTVQQPRRRLRRHQHPPRSHHLRLRPLLRWEPLRHLQLRLLQPQSRRFRRTYSTTNGNQLDPHNVASYTNRRKVAFIRRVSPVSYKTAYPIGNFGSVGHTPVQKGPKWAFLCNLCGL